MAMTAITVPVTIASTVTVAIRQWQRYNGNGINGIVNGSGNGNGIRNGNHNVNVTRTVSGNPNSIGDGIVNRKVNGNDIDNGNGDDSLNGNRSDTVMTTV